MEGQKTEGQRLNVKSGSDFVGSAFIGENTYGKYVSVKFFQHIPKGSVVFLSPRKGESLNL
jgi:hypothetical protein